ncbi:MAG: hypothetical protein AUI53_07095 [Acidobacteria bacterium 13_1_40CM_2_60_7]|nr:MAG: hypothetical protein AUH88_03340 [Acidobacteria bacterium 13_1_40CM_4_61_5]OLD61072.1 MAG: hypothetical protein AUI53_07095 [Acidobacteria bacterium 13_1_40CM_2_60_7]OLE87280.1 MAG: hypothetical protein AUG07_01170 [Acidobacteria bacterium 13_1_20CM_2_60_10]PYU06963.1 MAG: hypothetical protein DMG33_06010 [Acidobacteriota bacterium]
MAQEGTINIHRSIAGTGAAFHVTFAPYDADAGTAGVRRFQELQHVRAFLRVLGIGADYIREALRQLAAGRSASLPNVSLSDTAFRRAGFENIDNFARSVG